MSAQRVMAVAGVAVAAWLGASAQAQACSCAPPTPEWFKESDAAVIAELVKVDRDADGRTGRFVYDLSRVLKGRHRIDRPRLEIRSPLDSATCGLSQGRGRVGLLLDRYRGHWSASLCSEMSPKALRALARGEDPYARPYC